MRVSQKLIDENHVEISVKLTKKECIKMAKSLNIEFSENEELSDIISIKTPTWCCTCSNGSTRNIKEVWLVAAYDCFSWCHRKGSLTEGPCR